MRTKREMTEYKPKITNRKCEICERLGKHSRYGVSWRFCNGCVKEKEKLMANCNHEFIHQNIYWDICKKCGKYEFRTEFETEEDRQALYSYIDPTNP